MVLKPPVELRPITPEDIPGWRACMGVAFGRYSREGTDERYLSESGYDKSLAAFDGPEIVGTAAWFPVEVTMPGATVLPAASVVAVTVLPTHRRRGILRAMMHRQLADLREAGLPLAVLTASEAGIYGRYGYGWATSKCDYELDKRVAQLARPVSAPGRVRMLTAAEAEAAAPALWNEHRRLRPGELSVPPTFWEDYFHDPDWMKSGDRRRFFAAYEEGGLIEGFVDFRRVESSSPRERAVEVELLLTTSPHAYEALASFLLGIDLALTLRMDHRPPDEPLRHLLADPRRLRATRVVDDLWLRPLDVRAALEGRRYVPGGPDHLTIEVHDPLFPENEGRYELAVDADGGVSVSGPAPAVAGRAALELDVGVLGSVLLGGRRLAPLVPAGDVVEHEARAAWRADAMFLADREPFATISF